MSAHGNELEQEMGKIKENVKMLDDKVTKLHKKIKAGEKVPLADLKKLNEALQLAGHQGAAW